MNPFKATNPTMVTANYAAMAAGVAAIPTAVLLGHYWQLGAALLVWQLFNILGISVGAHRYFSHAAFKCNRFWQWVMAYLCMASLTGPPCIWAEAHVRHHRKADTPDDPYLAYALGGNTPLRHETSVAHGFIRKAIKDRLHALCLRYYWLYVGSFALGAVLIGLALWSSALAGLFWLFLVPAGLSQLTLRVVLWTGHVPSLGYRNHETKDTSNNWWLASLIAGGEGWHNNHHHRPGAANFGERWWEFDPGWWFIKVIRQ